MEHCVNAILKETSFTSISNLLNHYIVGIEKVGREKKTTINKTLVDQLQSNAKALLKIHNTDKSEIVEATFNRLLEK